MRQIVALKQDVDDKPASSALVHIHGDLYVDAAAVVAVETAREGSCQEGVAVAFRVANDSVTRFFPCPNRDAAQKLAAEIVERVNGGRLACVMTVTNPEISQAEIRKATEELCDKALRSHYGEMVILTECTCPDLLNGHAPGCPLHENP